MAERDGGLLQLPTERGQDGAGTPGGVGPSKRHDAGLELRRDLVGAAIGLGAAIGECAQATFGVAAKPPVHGPAINPVTLGHIDDGGAGVEGLPDGQVALLNHRELHEHAGILPWLG